MRKIMKWIIGLFLLSAILCIAVVVLMPSSEPETKPTSTLEVDALAPAETVELVVPTESKPTELPAPTDTPEPPVLTSGKVGDRVESEGIALVVVNVQKVKSAGIFEADAGNTFVDLEVIVENADRETTPYNPLYFKVKDANGYEYTSTLASLEPSLQSGELAKGEIARGHVAFEVPETATGLVVSYEPMVLFGGYETLRINLEEVSDQPYQVGQTTTAGVVGKVGERVISGGIAITVLSVQRDKILKLLNADPGNEFVDIEVIIENVDRDESPYNPLYFKIKDANAFEYSTAMEAIEPSLKSGTLVKGDMVRGHVAFEVKENTGGLVVSYEPEVLFGGYEIIRVNLEEIAEQPAPVPAPIVIEGTGSLGNSVESAGIAITILSVNRLNTVSGIPVDPGYTYVDIEVIIQNVSRDDTTPYNPLYFKVKDNQGYEYNTSIFSVDPSLISGDLVKGDQVRGHVTFTVLENAEGLVVSYEPQVLFGGYKTIRVSLEQ